MPDSLNERIAKKRGWKPPGSPEHTKRLKEGILPIGARQYDWLHPNGKSLDGMPLYDTDPAAMVELLTEMGEVKINPHPHGKEVIWIGRGIGIARALPAAIAEAWWNAMKGEKGG